MKQIFALEADILSPARDDRQCHEEGFFSVTSFENLDQDGLVALAKPFSEAVLRVGVAGGTWVYPQVMKAFQAEGISVACNHFYSVLPDLASISSKLWEGQPFARAWEQVSKDDYFPLLNDVLEFSQELKSLPRETQGQGFFWNNPMYPPLDSAVYYGLIRKMRPARVLEVGSGFSTLLAINALEKNGAGSISCVEPYPPAHLLASEGKLTRYYRSFVQDTPDEIYQELEGGDILFIDTAHASKVGSDVHDILFRVMPLLAPGVIVHIHDVFLPFEYPKHWYTDFGIIWNEQYAVLALLMNSNRYRVILPNYLACVERADWLRGRFKDFDIYDLTGNMGGARGASLWLRVNES